MRETARRVQRSDGSERQGRTIAQVCDEELAIGTVMTVNGS